MSNDTKDTKDTKHVTDKDITIDLIVVHPGAKMVSYERCHICDSEFSKDMDDDDIPIMRVHTDDHPVRYVVYCLDNPKCKLSALKSIAICMHEPKQVIPLVCTAYKLKSKMKNGSIVDGWSVRYVRWLETEKTFKVYIQRTPDAQSDYVNRLVTPEQLYQDNPSMSELVLDVPRFYPQPTVDIVNAVLKEAYVSSRQLNVVSKS